MKHGDKDGFRTIYDHNGDLILHPNEKKLVVEENVVPTLKSTWRYYGGEYLLEPSKGTVFLTTERMVFINIPERMYAIGGGEEARAMSAPVEKNFEIGEVKSGGAVREYFEIPNIEIMASERKEGAVSVGVMVNVYILSSGNQFHLSMVLPKESNLLLRLMNKQVRSLEDLVNNLKDLFKQTDWMFTEVEKKALPELKTTDTISQTSGHAPQQPSAFPNIPGVRLAPAPQRETTVKSGRNAPIKPNGEERSEKQSLKYFESLYSKGLIKEEIYRKLISQYKDQDLIKPLPASQSQAASAQSGQGFVRPSDIREDAEGVPGLERPRVPLAGELEVISPEVAPEPPTDTDEDIMSMLNKTLTDLGEEPAGKEDRPREAAKPKRVIRVVSKKA